MGSHWFSLWTSTKFRALHNYVFDASWVSMGFMGFHGLSRARTGSHGYRTHEFAESIWVLTCVLLSLQFEHENDRSDSQRNDCVFFVVLVVIGKPSK